MDDRPNLTNKQEAFAQAVITESTLSDAYRKAYDCSGMTAKTINEAASREAKNGKVSTRIAELRDRAENAADVSLERWIREQARIAFADVGELFDDNGALKPLSDIDDDARAGIASIETETRLEGNKTVTIRRMKFHNKIAALDSIGRALGAYEKDNRQQADIIPVVVNAPDWVE